MRKCEFVLIPVPLRPGDAGSPMTAMVHCRTHHMLASSDDDRCPVGKVEQAVEEGLAIIRAARDELPPKR
jgi:hypothetical protein